MSNDKIVNILFVFSFIFFLSFIDERLESMDYLKSPLALLHIFYEKWRKETSYLLILFPWYISSSLKSSLIQNQIILLILKIWGYFHIDLLSLRCLILAHQVWVYFQKGLSLSLSLSQKPDYSHKWKYHFLKWSQTWWTKTKDLKLKGPKWKET